MNALQHGLQIRLGSTDDFSVIKRIAHQHSTSLGFVSYRVLERGVEHRQLHVATLDGAGVVGFVNWHSRRDGWQTIYELAVERSYHGLGIGRQLLYSVPAPMRLKCTVDNARANAFYAGAGMRLIRQEQGRKRTLNVYEMQVLVIFCAGNNRLHPRIARAAGMAYGCQQFDTPRDYPFFVDVEFELGKQDWHDFMDKVRRWRPVMALVTDYTSPDARARMLAQVQALRAAGVLRVLVCPKFPGALADIPADCIVALSVPTRSTKFAGWLPDWREMQQLAGRKVHLLGGSVAKAAALIDRVRLLGGQVISVDHNAMQKAATYSVIWQDGRQYRRLDGRWEHGDYETTLRKSARNIQRYLNAPEAYLDVPSPLARKRRYAQRQMELL